MIKYYDMPQPNPTNKGNKNSLILRQSNKISRSPTVPGLRQAKAYRYLLMRARPELLKDDYHIVYQEELKDFLGSNDLDTLRDNIEALRKIDIRWDLLPQKGGNEDDLLWGTSPLLADCAIKRDKKGNVYFEYSFSPKMKKELANPKFYREIDLNLIREFQSSYSLKFYEFCCAALNPNDNYVITEFISKENFWELLGLGQDEYKNYYNFKKRVIQPAISEVNEMTDLNIELERVKRTSRKYEFRFKIRRQNVQMQLKLSNPELDDVVKRYEQATSNTRDSLKTEFLGEYPAMKKLKEESLKFKESFMNWIKSKYTPT